MTKPPVNQDEVDAQFLLSRPEFKRWFLRLLNTAGIGFDTFQGDPYYNAYQAGKGALGLEALQTLLDVDPQARLALEIERQRTLQPQEPESHDRTDD